MKLVIVVLLVFLVGCASTVLIKDGVTETEYLQDREKCDVKAYEIVGRAPSWDDKFNLTLWKRALSAEFYQCMYDKGYIRQ